MNGKERMSRTIDFQSPDFLPSIIEVNRNFLYDQDEEKWKVINDLYVQIGSDETSMWCWKDERKVIDGIVHTCDEWKTRWIDDGHGAITTYHPMENGYEDIDKAVFPDAADASRFLEADQALANRNGKYMIGRVWFTQFERMWMLRGFTNLLMDPYDEETADGFMNLKQRVLDVNLAMIDQWLARDVDGIFFSDDWGTQRGLLINPDEWRRLYKDAYAQMFDKVRKVGKHVWMHLCGNITSILPDLIELGLNVLNPVQPQAMDVDQLSRDYKGKVCFYGGVDVQGTMIRATPQEVKKELKHLIDIFGSREGGYIISTSHTIMPETPLDNVIALLEGILEYRTR